MHYGCIQINKCQNTNFLHSLLSQQEISIFKQASVIKRHASLKWSKTPKWPKQKLIITVLFGPREILRAQRLIMGPVALLYTKQRPASVSTCAARCPRAGSWDRSMGSCMHLCSMSALCWSKVQLNRPASGKGTGSWKCEYQLYALLRKERRVVRAWKGHSPNGGFSHYCQHFPTLPTVISFSYQNKLVRIEFLCHWRLFELCLWVINQFCEIVFGNDYVRVLCKCMVTKNICIVLRTLGNWDIWNVFSWLRWDVFVWDIMVNGLLFIT